MEQILHDSTRELILGLVDWFRGLCKQEVATYFECDVNQIEVLIEEPRRVVVTIEGVTHCDAVGRFLVFVRFACAGVRIGVCRF